MSHDSRLLGHLRLHPSDFRRSVLWGVWVPGVVCGRSRVGLVGWLDSGWRAREAGATCLLLKEGPQVHNTPLCSFTVPD